ncbi:MAG: META domain-containing protein [Cyclobacteriaceae bacterium]|nr:META domain-containing protein [Cyclobacteriaceae bacterium]
MKAHTSIFLSSLLFCCAPPREATQSSPKGEGTNPVTEAVEVSPNKYIDKQEAGIDFVAYGNEPGWSLDIDLQSFMDFKTTAGDQGIRTAAVKESTMPDSQAISYFAETEKGSLKVTLMKKACMDNMSGEKFTYEVRMEVKYKGEEDFVLFEGCGKYLPDYRLHNTWELTEMNGKIISSEGLPKGAPRIEFNTTESKVLGMGGCNSFFGTMDVKENEITIGALGATKMACSGLKIEEEFFSTLSGKGLTFLVAPPGLILKKGNERVMAFKPFE